MSDINRAPLFGRRGRPTMVATMALLAALAALPGDSTPRDRALAAVFVLCASVIAGALWGFRRGIGLSILFAGYLSVLSANYLPGQDTFPSLTITYLLVMAAGAALAALATTRLEQARSATRALTTELTVSERRRQVVVSISKVGRALSSNTANSAEVRLELAELTSLLDLDVFIVRRNADGGRSSQIESWVTRTGADEMLAANDGKLRWATLSNMRNALAAGEVFAFSSLDDIPEPDRGTLSHGVARLESVINLPIHTDGNWLGHAALGSRAGGRNWSPEDVVSLRILTDMIGSAWLRDRQTEELKSVIELKEQAIGAQTALTEGTRILLAHDHEEPLGETLRLVMEALDGHVSYIEWFDHDPVLGLVSRPIEHLYRQPYEKSDSVTWPLDSSPVAAAKLLAGEPSIFESAEEEAASDPDRVEPYDAPLSAECNVPIVSEGATVGFVGVGNFEPRSWTDVEVSIMKSFALMLGAYFERETATRQLEDLVTAKDRFIAAVSHELRTPLAVVVGLAAEMEDNDEAFTSQERAEFVGMIRRQSNEVSNIIDDLLVSTRISETELTVINAQFMLDELLGDVLRDLPADVTAKIIELDMHPVEAIADPLRTRQIVRNLITNAYRYGGENVMITVRSEGDRAILEVADDGPGVPTERRNKIFEAYHTSGGERTVTAAIGLGLTVSRQLARLMGGDVTYVHGENPRFALELRRVTGSHQLPATTTLHAGDAERLI
jgi:GAF domain-containing protein